MILPDPQAKRGGRCAWCGAKLTEMVVAHLDPFCRTDCARQWHDRERARLAVLAAAVHGTGDNGG